MTLEQTMGHPQTGGAGLKKSFLEKKRRDFELPILSRTIGHKVMLLNAREIYRKDIGTKMILLAIEDITEHKRLEDLLTESEGALQACFERQATGYRAFRKNAKEDNPC